MKSCPVKAYALANKYGPFEFFGLDVNPWLRSCQETGFDPKSDQEKWKAVTELDSRFVDSFGGDTLYRGIHMPFSWKPSDIYCEAGYLSASKVISHAMNFVKGTEQNVLFKINYRGTYHIDLRDAGASEAEFLLPRGLIFNVSNWIPEPFENMQIQLSPFGPPTCLLTLTQTQ